MLFLQRYHTEAKVEEVDGFAMVTKMAANVEIMMQHKIDAIKVSSIKAKGCLTGSTDLPHYLIKTFPSQAQLPITIS